MKNEPMFQARYWKTLPFDTCVWLGASVITVPSAIIALWQVR